MPDPSLFSGMPIIMMTDTLVDTQRPFPRRLRVVPISFGSRYEMSFGGGEASPPSDILLAIVQNSNQRLVLTENLTRHNIILESIFILEQSNEVNAIIIDQLINLMNALFKSELEVRQSLIEMREEAEDTRHANQVLRDSIVRSLPSQTLLCSFECLPAGADSTLILSGKFDLAVRTCADVHRLASVAIHVADGRFQPDDRLILELHGEESGRVLGAWDLPAPALPLMPGWIMVDFPLPVEVARETATVVIKGSFAPDSWLALSQAQRVEPHLPNEGAAVALRLLTSDAPRIVRSPWWNWTALGLLQAQCVGRFVEAIPGRCWLGARLLGHARRINAAEGAWCFRIEAGASAILLLPDVPLNNAAAVVARIGCRSGAGHDVMAAVALLPVDRAASEDIASVIENLSHRSAIQDLTNIASALTLSLVSGAPEFSHVVLAIYHSGDDPEDFAIVECTGISLLQKDVSEPRTFKEIFLGERSCQKSFVAFDDVIVDESFDSEHYHHLDFSLRNLTDGTTVWDHVKFKLYEQMGRYGLEFRAASDWPAVFQNWPSKEKDEFGQIYKICSPEELADAALRLPEHTDRRFILALAAVLPNIVQTLRMRGTIAHATAAFWLVGARNMYDACRFSV